jgi:hypothetical protein
MSFVFTDISGMEDEKILSGSSAKQHEQQLKLLQEKVCSFLVDGFTVLLVLAIVNIYDMKDNLAHCKMFGLASRC